MSFDPANTAFWAVSSILAVVIALAAFGVGLGALRHSRRASRNYRRISETDRDVVDVLLDRVTAIDANTVAIERLGRQLEAARGDLSNAIRHLAVVRYDAFREVSGRQSFTAALLDDTGDGLVITSLCGRSGNQIIAKGVSGGGGAGLSPEEVEAVRHALDNELTPKRGNP